MNINMKLQLKKLKLNWRKQFLIKSLPFHGLQVRMPVTLSYMITHNKTKGIK